MTDEFDRLLEGALAVRADHAPQCAGVADVRRRVRRRRQRRSALTALPVLVGAGAAATWVRSSEQQSVASSGTDVVSTTTDGMFVTTVTSSPEAGNGFRCVAETMTGYGSGGWAYFDSCEPWTVIASTPASTTPAVEPTTTLWAGPSTESVVFVNASTFNGVAMQMMSQRFGAGQPVSAPTKSPTSFVMYTGSENEPLAAAIAAELQLPLQVGLDDLFVPAGLQPAPVVAVVIGDDLAAEMDATVPDEPTTVPPATLPTTGVAMRCWEPSKVLSGDDAYRYFQTCENRADITGTTTESTLPSGTTTPTLAGADCLPGQYTIVETDMSRQEVAGKFDLTVEEMDAANSENPGYPAFYPGLVIAIPCPSGS